MPAGRFEVPSAENAEAPREAERTPYMEDGRSPVAPREREERQLRNFGAQNPSSSAKVFRSKADGFLARPGPNRPPPR